MASATEKYSDERSDTMEVPLDVPSLLHVVESNPPAWSSRTRKNSLPATFASEYGDEPSVNGGATTFTNRVQAGVLSLIQGSSPVMTASQGSRTVSGVRAAKKTPLFRGTRRALFPMFTPDERPATKTVPSG